MSASGVPCITVSASIDSDHSQQYTSISWYRSMILEILKEVSSALGNLGAHPERQFGTHGGPLVTVVEQQKRKRETAMALIHTLREKLLRENTSETDTLATAEEVYTDVKTYMDAMKTWRDCRCEQIFAANSVEFVKVANRLAWCEVVLAGLQQLIVALREPATVADGTTITLDLNNFTGSDFRKKWVLDAISFLGSSARGDSGMSGNATFDSMPAPFTCGPSLSFAQTPANGDQVPEQLQPSTFNPTSAPPTIVITPPTDD